MGSATKALILLTVGFALGVGVSQFLRRQYPPRPGVPPPIPESAPIPPAASPTTPESPAVDSEKPLPVSSKARQGDLPRTALIEQKKIVYGRAPKPVFDDLLDAPTWDEFYQRCKERKWLAGGEYENLVFRRVMKELGADERITAALKDLLYAEQVDVTRSIVESVGGAAGIEKLSAELGAKWPSIYDDWRRKRELIRLSHEAKYLELLSVDQLALFNDHLRNSEIGLHTSYGNEQVHYLIAGVGKKPK